MRRILLLGFLVAIAACDEARRPVSPVSPGKPSCALPICAPCACDTTTECDMDCSDCDPECRNCRAEGDECAMPRDAGPVTPSDGGPGQNADAAPSRIDAGPCTFPVSQGLSEPCCRQHGIDACGAGLFCEAFDGRTQTTCYAEGSRGDGQECRDDLHCSGGRCPPSTMRCGPGPGDRCSTNGPPCAPDGAGRMYYCDPNLRLCIPSPIPCDANTHAPCGPGESCYLQFGDRGEISTLCALTGSLPRGAECSTPSDCQRDHACLVPFQPVCARTCSASRPCPDGSCETFGQPVGVCLDR